MVFRYIKNYKNQKLNKCTIKSKMGVSMQKYQPVYSYFVLPDLITNTETHNVLHGYLTAVVYSSSIFIHPKFRSGLYDINSTTRSSAAFKR